MKSLLLAAILLFSGAALTPADAAFHPDRAATHQVAPTGTVYVCISKNSVAYHSSKECAGLNRCTHEVREMSTSDAQGIGKRACQKCY